MLVNLLCPGDCLVMTAAVECLHLAHPGKYRVSVESTCPAVFEGNPLIEPVAGEPRQIEMHYPLVHASDQRPVHFMQGYCEWLEAALGVKVPLVVNRPTLRLTEEEKALPRQVQAPYWIVNAGTKDDFTCKFWGKQRYQDVIDSLRGRVQFVQVGEAHHRHEPLDGVIDLIGRTDLRQLIRLVYHADGVLCGTTFLMHAAAAFEKPAVIVAGAREPRSWNQYPRQVLLNTIGTLPCNRDKACWVSRTVPLGSEPVSKHDFNTCRMPILLPEPTPKCLAIIEPRTVVDAVMAYVEGGTL